jgi:hypothetical protein
MRKCFLLRWSMPKGRFNALCRRGADRERGDWPTAAWERGEWLDCGKGIRRYPTNVFISTGLSCHGPSRRQPPEKKLNTAGRGMLTGGKPREPIRSEDAMEGCRLGHPFEKSTTFIRRVNISNVKLFASRNRQDLMPWLFRRQIHRLLGVCSIAESNP